MGHRLHNRIDNYGRVGSCALPQDVVRHRPIIAAQVDGNDGAIQLIERQPCDEVVVERAMRIDHEQTASAASVGKDVLPDQPFKKPALARSGVADDVQVGGTSITRENKRSPVSRNGAEREVVALRACHRY